MYKTEEEFLKHYDPKAFEQLSMTSDILLLSVSSEKQDNYRKINDKKISILRYVVSTWWLCKSKHRNT